MLGTGSVMSDYVLVTVILPLKPGDEDCDLLCRAEWRARLKALPAAALCARADERVRLPAVEPLDETDSLLVFDDVFVPWEDVFISTRISS